MWWVFSPLIYVITANNELWKLYQESTHIVEKTMAGASLIWLQWYLVW